MQALGTQSAELTWRAGAAPVSVRFDDPYFSQSDGLAEARHVFLAGNGLPTRFEPGFVVAELGFGTGLNALAGAAAWRGTGAPGRLRFVSFEEFPMRAADMARALAPWPELAKDAASLVAAWANGARRIALPGLDLEVIEGDARATLPRWDGRAHAWFLDGFSPARNPELWTPELLRAVAARTTPGGACATYSAAGVVRRTLAAAGFAVTRRPGYGRKRHMTTGRLGA